MSAKIWSPVSDFIIIILSLSLSPITPSKRICYSLSPARKMHSYVRTSHGPITKIQTPVGGIRRTTCGECNNPSYIVGLDSSRTSPDEHSKRYDPSPCGVIHHYRNDNCFWKFSPRPDATTVFTMSNHDRSDVPQHRSHPSLPIIYYTRICCAFVYTRRYSRTL